MVRILKVKINNKYITITFLTIILIVISIIVYFIFWNKSSFESAAVNVDIAENDWAFYNYSQTINDSKGISGIDVNILPAWNITKGDPDLVVAVIDTGVDYECTILEDKLLINASDPVDGKDNDGNGYIDDYYGWDFYNGDNSMYDDYLYDYHGTYICTTIARVAPEVKILPVKFLKSSSGSLHDAILSIKYAISRGARIINCSWNFNDYNEELYELIKNNPDILFVCAAGNSNINLDNESLYLCSYDLDNIITVISIDNAGNIYEASGYGSNTDIAAPGVDVDVIFPDNNETTINGTSVSASFVSAAAALMLSENDSLSPSKIKSIILASAQYNKNLESLCASGGYLDIAACLTEKKNNN